MFKSILCIGLVMGSIVAKADVIDIWCYDDSDTCVIGNDSAQPQSVKQIAPSAHIVKKYSKKSHNDDLMTDADYKMHISEDPANHGAEVDDNGDLKK